MAFPPKTNFPLSLLLLLFLLLATSAQEEEFTEELLLKPLPDRKILAHFHFQSEAPLAADSFSRHHHLFPKSISQLVQKFHIKAMELSFTQGRWSYERWGGFDSISSHNAKPPGVELWAVFDVPLHQVESELLQFVEAVKNSPVFSQFIKDISVAKDVRVKVIQDICGEAKFSDVTKNFLVIVAENGRLKNINTIAKRFAELSMAYKGEVKATVTTVVALPAEEEKALKETLQEIIGSGAKVQLEQKIDPSILGGLVIEFSQKVFDMSIKTRAQQMERVLREPVSISNI